MSVCLQILVLGFCDNQRDEELIWKILSQVLVHSSILVHTVCRQRQACILAHFTLHLWLDSSTHMLLISVLVDEAKQSLDSHWSMQSQVTPTTFLLSGLCFACNGICQEQHVHKVYTGIHGHSAVPFAGLPSVPQQRS